MLCAALQVLGLGWCGLQDAGAITLGAVLKTNQVEGWGAVPAHARQSAS